MLKATGKHLSWEDPHLRWLRRSLGTSPATVDTADPHLGPCPPPAVTAGPAMVPETLDQTVQATWGCGLNNKTILSPAPEHSRKTGGITFKQEKYVHSVC